MGSQNSAQPIALAALQLIEAQPSLLCFQWAVPTLWLKYLFWFCFWLMWDWFHLEWKIIWWCGGMGLNPWPQVWKGNCCATKPILQFVTKCISIYIHLQYKQTLYIGLTNVNILYLCIYIMNISYNISIYINTYYKLNMHKLIYFFICIIN